MCEINFLVMSISEYRLKSFNMKIWKNHRKQIVYDITDCVLLNRKVGLIQSLEFRTSLLEFKIYFKIVNKTIFSETYAFPVCKIC